MKLYLWLVCILVFLNSCANKNEKPAASAIPIETITWANFSKKEIRTFPPVDVIKSKRYIGLESGDSSMFGAADRIHFLDSTIYILDKRLKKIVSFNQEGRSLHVLQKVGQGPGEYLQITDFSVDAAGNIYIIDGVSDKLMVYNYRCEFVSAAKLPFEADLVQCLDGGDFIIGLSTWNSHPETTGRRLLVADRNLNIKNTLLDYDQYNDERFWISYYRFISADSKIYYNKPIEDYVYVLAGDGALEKAYYFDFGSDRIPLDWRKDIESKLSEIEQKHKCLKNHTIITDNYIIGTLWDKTETKPFLVDRKSDVVYINEAIAESDISDIGDFRENSIVSIIYPGKYDDGRETELPADVRRHLATDNFVICVTELL